MNFYAVSPKTFADRQTFSLVPWFLSIYLVLTCIRIIAARYHRLPRTLLYGSILADIGLLLAMIFAFHLQYKQPPSFFLKAPTLLYVFIFIALRALRFETRFVIAAGCATAAGWIALVGYAAYASGGREMVTRDYVRYMTSNSILVGAELDKVITILMVTAILVLAISRARKLMVKAVVEGAAASELSRFFAPEIARSIVEAEPRIRAGQGQHRQAAIMSCAIRGFTRLANAIEPNELICLLADYQALVVPIIHRHGGSIDKFMGDGILATFGAAVPSQTYAADAMRTCEEMMEAAEEWNAELNAEGKPVLSLGAAVATGPVIFGAVGDETRLEFTVIGNPVNLSAKLEKHTKSEGVRALTTLAAWDLAVLQGYRPKQSGERLLNRIAQGVEEPLDLVVLVS